LSPAPEQFKDAIVNVPEHVVYRSFEAETLLLNLETGQYHGLNPTGGRMLELLKDTDGSVRQATERLAAEVDMPPDEIADDLASFCADLAERGLIEVDDFGEGSDNSR
jgi:Coenzyme PQQ synthesis protein D (PqqD)